MYRQIWRYGGIQCYIRLLFVDAAAFFVNLAIERILPLFYVVENITFARLLALACMNCLAALSIRMIYRYAFKCGTEDSRLGAFLRWLLRLFAGDELGYRNPERDQKIKIAIVGAGRVGALWIPMPPRPAAPSMISPSFWKMRRLWSGCGATVCRRWFLPFPA